MRENRSESIEDYYRIMEKIPVPIAVFRVETDDMSGVPKDILFTFMNDRYEDILPFTKEECIGKSFFDIFTNETDRTKWNYLHWNASHNGMTNEYENYAPPIDKYFSLTVFPLVYGYCGSILWDITIEKKFSNMVWDFLNNKENGETIEQVYNRHRRSNVMDMGAYTTTIIYLNTETGRFDTLKNRDVINSAEDEDYSVFMEKMRNYLSDEDYAVFEETFSLEHIRKNASENIPVETELRIHLNNVEGWIRIEGVYLSNLMDNVKDDFIISFKNIGEQRMKTLQLRSDHEKQIKELTQQNEVYRKTIEEILSSLGDEEKKKAERLLNAI